MRLRRKRLLSVLRENEIAPTVAVFPMLGALGDDGSVPPVKVGGPVTESDYIGDGIINPHPRFAALSANVRKRRERKSISASHCFTTPTPRNIKIWLGSQPIPVVVMRVHCCGDTEWEMYREKSMEMDL